VGLSETQNITRGSLVLHKTETLQISSAHHLLCLFFVGNNPTTFVKKITTTMSSSTILVLPGDGVGPEVVEEALKVLRVVDQHSNARFNIQTDLFGGCSIDAHGVPITETVLQKAKEADAVLAGAVGGPKW
jgi:hypothetical protein